MLTEHLGHIIIELLRDQHVAVLPGFGGFVTDHVGAELDSLRHRIQPPHRTVIFNAKLSHNDGLLVTTVATERGISYLEADTFVTDAISELRFRLDAGEQVLFEGLGTLRKSMEGRVEFIAVPVPDVLDDFYGLKTINLRPVEKDNVDRMRELVSADGPVATKVRTLPLKQIASYAAAAVAIGFFAWIPVQQGLFGTGTKWAHQLNPLALGVESTYHSRTFNENWLTKGYEQKDALADKFEKEYLELHLVNGSDHAIVVKTEAVPSAELNLNEASEIASSPTTATRHMVIAATFGSKSDADAYVQKMTQRGFAAAYAGKDANGHMVAYGSYTNLEDAQKMLASVSLSNKEARIVSGT
jgi:hypothetical protein